MKHLLSLIVSILLVSIAAGMIPGCERAPEETDAVMERAPEGPAYGGQADVAFANSLWTNIQGYENWRLNTDFYSGTEPHGIVLRMYYNVVNVQGAPRHVIVKDNFGGEGATQETVANNPSQYLGAVTIMVQREEGYDPDNMNWFWVRYMPDGSVATDQENRPIAGRATSCIDCHRGAPGGDFVFTN